MRALAPAQGLKPISLIPFRLKPCPDTRPIFLGPPLWKCNFAEADFGFQGNEPALTQAFSVAGGAAVSAAGNPVTVNAGILRIVNGARTRN